MLQPLFKARLPERAGRLQHGFSHGVPELLEQHPEKEEHEYQESEEHPHVQAQVPAPAERHGQRGGSHQKFSGGRHGVRLQTHPSLLPRPNNNKKSTLFLPLGPAQGWERWCAAAVGAIVQASIQTALVMLQNSHRLPWFNPPAGHKCVLSVMRQTCWWCEHSVGVVHSADMKWWKSLCGCSVPPLPCQTPRTKPTLPIYHRRESGGERRLQRHWLPVVHFNRDKSDHWWTENVNPLPSLDNWCMCGETKSNVCLPCMSYIVRYLVSLY